MTVIPLTEKTKSQMEATFPEPIEPLCLIFGIDGVELAPAVQLFDQRQASFDCSQYFDMFYEGQMIGPAVLSLETEGMAVVYPVVKSKTWPMIHVEFMALTEEDRMMIAQFLAKSGGSRRPPSNRHPIAANLF